jgi:hypothetical protein
MQLKGGVDYGKYGSVKGICGKYVFLGRHERFN